MLIWVDGTHCEEAGVLAPAQERTKRRQSTFLPVSPRALCPLPSECLTWIIFLVSSPLGKVNILVSKHQKLRLNASSLPWGHIMTSIANIAMCFMLSRNRHFQHTLSLELLKNPCKIVTVIVVFLKTRQARRSQATSSRSQSHNNSKG